MTGSDHLISILLVWSFSLSLCQSLILKESSRCLVEVRAGRCSLRRRSLGQLLLSLLLLSVGSQRPAGASRAVPGHLVVPPSFPSPLVLGGAFPRLVWASLLNPGISSPKASHIRVAGCNIWQLVLCVSEIGVRAKPLP